MTTPGKKSLFTADQMRKLLESLSDVDLARLRKGLGQDRYMTSMVEFTQPETPPNPAKLQALTTQWVDDDGNVHTHVARPNGTIDIHTKLAQTSPEQD